MRGGNSVDDDSYSIRQLAHAIIHETAAVVQQELYDTDARGLDPDPSLYIVANEELRKYGYQPTDRPVILRRSCAPKTLLWKGEPAITDFRTAIDGATFVYKRDSATALQTAIGARYVPGSPAYWIEGDKLIVAIPLAIGTASSVSYRYIPANYSLNADGSERDPETEVYPIPKSLWSKIKQRLLGIDINTLLQTSPNRDKQNDSNDLTVATK